MESCPPSFAYLCFEAETAEEGAPPTVGDEPEVAQAVCPLTRISLLNLGHCLLANGVFKQLI